MLFRRATFRSTRCGGFIAPQGRAHVGRLAAAQSSGFSGPSITPVRALAAAPMALSIISFKAAICAWRRRIPSPRRCTPWPQRRLNLVFRGDLLKRPIAAEAAHQRRRPHTSSPRSASSATFAFSSPGNLRRLLLICIPPSDGGIRLNDLSDFPRPPHRSIARADDRTLVERNVPARTGLTPP